MRNLITILSIIILSSCSKEWDCTVKTSINGGEWSEGTTVTFKGTKEEMKDYEEKSSNKTDTFDGTTIETKMECK